MIEHMLNRLQVFPVHTEPTADSPPQIVDPQIRDTGEQAQLPPRFLVRA